MFRILPMTQRHSESAACFMRCTFKRCHKWMGHHRAKQVNITPTIWRVRVNKLGQQPQQQRRVGRRWLWRACTHVCKLRVRAMRAVCFTHTHARVWQQTACTCVCRFACAAHSVVYYCALCVCVHLVFYNFIAIRRCAHFCSVAWESLGCNIECY
jgi:hypothetical protein